MATTTVDQNKELVRRDIEEIWNEGNYDLVDELYAADFVHHDPSYPGEVRGPDAQKEFIRMYNETFQGSPSLTIEEVMAEGDLVTVRWTGRGTHEEPFMGIDPTHEDIEVSGMTLARMEDGQFAEMWTNYDALGMLQQIGAVDAPTG